MVRAPTALLLGVSLIVAGAGFASPSMTVAGLGMGVLALVAVGWVELARPRRLERARGPGQIVEGEPYPLELVASGGLLPLPGGELRDPILVEPLAVGPRWAMHHRAEIALAGRGRRRLDPPALEVRDPLGLHVRTVRGAEPGELLVLPRIEPVIAPGRAGSGRRGALGGVEDAVAARTAQERGLELEVDGLRPYREGTPGSRIHWPAVARTGELIERRLIAGGDSAPLVVLDSADPDDPASLDAAVRAAASLAFHLAGAGGCALLLPGARRPIELDPERRGWPAAHARLAVVAPAAAPPAPPRALRRGAVFWVAARARARMPASLRTPAAPGYLVVPLTGERSDGQGATAFTVAGCVGVPAGAGARARSAA